MVIVRRGCRRVMHHLLGRMVRRGFRRRVVMGVGDRGRRVVVVRRRGRRVMVGVVGGGREGRVVGPVGVGRHRGLVLA